VGRDTHGVVLAHVASALGLLLAPHHKAATLLKLAPLSDPTTMEQSGHTRAKTGAQGASICPRKRRPDPAFGSGARRG
jgi:hypothetical protein